MNDAGVLFHVSESRYTFFAHRFNSGMGIGGISIAERGKVTKFVTLQTENYAGREKAKASSRCNS